MIGLILTAVAALPLGSVSQVQDASELRGLWGGEVVFGPEIRGTLTVQRAEAGWVAEIGGRRAALQESERGRRAEFPEGSGTLLLDVAPGDDAWNGHWIQPAGRMLFQPFSTPITLASTDAKGDHWSTEVRPLDDRHSVYIEFVPDDQGRLTTRMRNPELNLGARYNLGRMELRGRELRLLDSSGTRVLLRGELDEGGDRWTLHLSDWGISVELSRRNRDTAPGYYPRPGNAGEYAYHKPDPLADGWPVAEPEDVGLDREPLVALVQSILAREYDSSSTPYIHGLVIASRGKLVLDEYFHGYDAERTHDTRSSTKSLTAMLTGLAMDRGAPFDVETPVLEVFEDRDDIQNVDEVKRRLKVKHLLSMSSGLDCDDGDGSNPGNEDNMQSQDEQPDWHAYALDLSMVREPGERGLYCTAGINLLGGVLEATGHPLDQLLREAYAEPLEIPIYHMNLSPTGHPYMGGGIRFRPRDHLKLGQLLADQGRWKGQQIVPAAWIEEMSRAHASLNEADDYGYGVWRKTLHKGDQAYQAIYASGNGGQVVIALPEADVVVLFSAGNYGDFRTWSRFLSELVPDYVLPAILD